MLNMRFLFSPCCLSFFFLSLCSPFFFFFLTLFPSSFFFSLYLLSFFLSILSLPSLLPFYYPVLLLSFSLCFASHSPRFFVSLRSFTLSHTHTHSSWTIHSQILKQTLFLITGDSILRTANMMDKPNMIFCLQCCRLTFCSQSLNEVLALRVSKLAKHATNAAFKDISDRVNIFYDKMMGSLHVSDDNIEFLVFLASQRIDQMNN